MGRSRRCLTLLACCALVVQAAIDVEEVKAAAFFGKTTAHGTPQPIDRYPTLTPAQFQALALNGKPFIVEDAGQNQPYVGWTCDRFRKEYPNGVVKMEYTQGAKESYQKITSDWETKLYKVKNTDPNGPQYAPWYWGVKGADDPEEARTIFKGGQNPLKKVQKEMRLPSFVRDTQENRNEILGSPEFWFSTPNAGASMHMDGHCESTLAIQLHGRRKWRLGWVPPVPNGTFYQNGAYGDGAIYGKAYTPPLEAVVEEGQALFMPSAFLHESNNIGEGCAASLTFQFRDPMPAGYWRSSLRHLRRSGDYNECWGHIGNVASFGQKGKKAPKLAQFDKDKDGKISFEEASKSNVHRAAHVFHDLDGDSFVTEAELERGWADYVASEKEAKTKGIKRVIPKSYSYLETKDEL